MEAAINRINNSAVLTAVQKGALIALCLSNENTIGVVNNTAIADDVLAGMVPGNLFHLIPFGARQ